MEFILKKLISLLLYAIISLSLITACSSNDDELDDEPRVPVRTEVVRALTAAELLALGEKFLLELDYEQAIIHLLAYIEIEPRDEHGYMLLADAYEKTGNLVKRQGVFKAGYMMMPESDFMLEQLFGAVIENDDADEIHRIIGEMRFLNNFRITIIENQLQSLYDSGNTGFMKVIIDSLYDHDADISPLILTFKLWLVYHHEHENEEERIDSIIQLIDSRQIPELTEGEELYIGEYDDEGRRSGFGIAFYGEGVKLNSVIYVGDWIEGVRSGNGVAFDNNGTFLRGSWSNDLPNGQLTYIWSRGYTRVSSFSDGLGYGAAHTYRRDGSLDSVHLNPKTSVLQSFIVRPDLFYGIHETENMRIDCYCAHIVWDAPVPEN